MFCTLLFLATFVVCNSHNERVARNAGWFFDTQIDHAPKDGQVELHELIATMRAVHPDAFSRRVDGDAKRLELPSNEPLMRFIESRDSSGAPDGKISRAEFVDGAARRFAFRTRDVSFSVADEQSNTLQFHLAWGSAGAETSMLLTFVNFAKASAPTIRYRVHGSSAAYQYVACNTTTYDAGIWGWNGWIYSGQMSALLPDTQYDYGVATDGSMSSSFTSDQTFRTARKSIAPSRVSRYAWYGDQGSYFPEGFVTAAAICTEVSNASNAYGAVIHAGDLAYATSLVGDSKEISGLWDVWSELIACAGSKVAYMTANGNHEDPYDYASFKHRFTMPNYAASPPPPTGDRFWYSADHEHVHWLFLDMQVATDPEQLAFVDADLAQAARNRARRPWIVAVGHRPMLSSDNGEWSEHNPTSPHFQAYAPMFEKYNVDMYLCGHMHMYEQIKPTFANGSVAASAVDGVYTRPRMPVQIVQGTAGIFMFTETFRDPQPAWSAVRAAAYFGFSRLTFNQTHAHHEYVATFEFEDSFVSDEFWIVK